MNFDHVFNIFSKNYTLKQLFLYVVFSFALGWGILWIVNLTIKSYPPYITHAPESIRVVAFFITLVFLLIALPSIGKWLINLRRRNKIYKFRTQDFPEKWIFNGATSLITNPSGLHVQSSRAGVLLKNHYWKDFRMSFKLKYAGHGMDYIGIVFRAIDLENYFMIEVIKEGFLIKVQPLVRYQGAWETSVEKIIGMSNWDKFVEVRLEVSKDTVSLKVDGHLYEWTLPTHVDVNHIEAGTKQIPINTGSDTKGNENAKVVPEIPFRQNFGLIGFRAHMHQGAYIADLKVKPL